MPTEEPPVRAAMPADADVDAEIEQLRKQRELLELRQTVGRLERGADAAPVTNEGRSNVSIRDVTLIMRKFDGSVHTTYDVKKFLADLEKFFCTVLHTPTYKFLALRSLLTDAAQDFLSGSRAADYNELRAELINEFGRSLSTTELIDQLRSRQWDRSAETMHRFVLRMQGLARRGEIREEEFIDIVIDNMRLPREAATLLMTSAPTIAA